LPAGRERGAENILLQPIDGSPGHQVTDFTSENISQFQGSPDGKTFAVARVHDASDVVILCEE
jgi:hypothetical protein